ncbi:hypothetical protein BC828DRAFT_391123 [Blastocladiella britannica]|nr:hypothetical protein BC828DRAFT_391123 [Blastocladiella britannica]
MRRSAAPSLPLLSPVPALARGPVGHGNKRITRETQLDQWSLMLLAFSLVTATLLTAVLRGTATPSFSSLHPLPLLPPLVPTSSNGGGFAAANAHAHIAAITVAEHPMPSVANWAARSYILDVVRRSIASAPTRNVQVMDSTDWVAWTTDDPAMGLGDRVLGRSTIVQSSNVVVRIPGTIANGTRRSAVLLSAHYDSVPTTKGVGDDALGIGTLLEILRVLVQDVEPLPYTVLLNFNNGEELDLYGAQVLARSPSIWSEVGAFINIGTYSVF